jgi:flagellar M-ring protein FliF
VASGTETVAALRERWSKLAPKTRIALLGGGAAVLALALVLWAGGSEPSWALLYGNIGADDAGRIVEKLRDLHVPYKIEGESAIWVPEEQVHETRLNLASEGLPSGGGVGFEIFDEQRFGESEFSEQVKYHRALEGELGRTISHLTGVERARVHLVLPNRSLFTSTETPASASVALEVRPGRRLRDDQVRGIVHLVASSVRGLDAEHVTVVDGEGRSLSGGGGSHEEVSSNALAFRTELERTKERAIQELLDRTLGAGTSVVRVAADVSFAREERTEEQYDPTKVVPRSYQLTEERTGGDGATTAGVPGAASNLPGGEAPTNATVANGGLVRRSETRNFEVSKIVRRAVEPVGRVEKLQVAVVVDGRYAGKGRARRFVPRSADELTRLQAIVESAAGLQRERGDRLTVECVRFAAPAVPAGRPDLGPVDPLERFEPYLPYAAGALALLVLGPVLLVVARRRRKALAAQRPAGALSAANTAGAVLDPTLADPRLAEQARASGESRSLAADLAGRDPDLAARVVRGWLSEGRT